MRTCFRAAALLEAVFCLLFGMPAGTSLTGFLPQAGSAQAGFLSAAGLTQTGFLPGGITAYGAETGVSSPVLRDIDTAHIDDLIAQYEPGALYGVAVMDLMTGEMVGTSGKDVALSSSAILGIPILYTIQKQIEAQQRVMDTGVTFHYTSNGRVELTEADEGREFSTGEMLSYMLRYSENNATNSLLQDLGFDVINETCSSGGYSSVKIVNLIGDTKDNTETDNYISAADAARMIQYLYNGPGPVGREFLEQNMIIQDRLRLAGLGRDISSYVNFLNLNAWTSTKFNEVGLVEDTEHQQYYVIAYLANNVNDPDAVTKLKSAAADVGSYIYSQAEAGIAEAAQAQSESQAASEAESQEASEAESQETSESESQAASERESEEAAMAAEPGESPYPSSFGEVVSDGENTYWWQYGEDAVPVSFLCDLQHQSSEDSRLMRQESGGDPEEIAAGGFGPICLTTNGRIWYQTEEDDNSSAEEESESLGNNASSVAVCLDPDTGDKKTYDGRLDGVTEDASAVILKRTGTDARMTVTDGDGLEVYVPYDDVNDAAYAGSRGGRYYFAVADADGVTIRSLDPASGSWTDVMTGSTEDGYPMTGTGVCADIKGSTIYAGIYDVEGSESCYQYGEIMSFSLADQTVRLLVSAEDNQGLMDDHFSLIEDEDGGLKICYRGGSDDNATVYSQPMEVNIPWTAEGVYAVPADGSGKPEPYMDGPLVRDDGFCFMGGILASREKGSDAIKMVISKNALDKEGWTDLYGSVSGGKLSQITSFDAAGQVIYLTLTRFTEDEENSFGWHTAYTSESVLYRTEAGSDELEEICRY